MSLTLVATPIGNSRDISARAIELLTNADLIILEEFKESTTFLRSIGISGKKYEQLNEHSTAEDLKKLTEACATQNVVLITDCGTPGFCDPGADLVRECRNKKIAVQTVPGASSLMGLLSLSSRRLDQFVFRGFLPAESEARRKAWNEILKETRAFILMDTPYRLSKMISEAKEFLSDRKILLTLDLTQPTERVYEGSPQEVAKLVDGQKAEFMLLVYPRK